MNAPIIPITDFIRKFGAYADLLPSTEGIILTRDGRPFATIQATPEEKNRELLKLFGAWKNTPLDSDAFWKKVLKRKSRKTPIVLLHMRYLLDTSTLIDYLRKKQANKK